MRLLKNHLVFVWLALFAMGAQATAVESFFTAVRNDNESAVVALTLRGFDLNARDEQGDTGLLVAVRNESTKVADFLLQQNVVNVEARNQAGESALMMAALKGLYPQAKRLIERRAEVNKPGWTPLHYAASNPGEGSVAMVRLLLERFAYIDAESPNKTTPLMMAARYGNDAVVKLLLEEGADPMLRNEQGLTALDFARQADRQDAQATISAFVRLKRAPGTW